jgi:hypothetical protein
MANTQVVVTYQKNGAIFNDANQAQLDRFNAVVQNQALYDNCVETNHTLLRNQIFTQPINYQWNQGTFTLTLTKIVTNMTAYQDTWGPLIPQIEALFGQNGWASMGEVDTPI